MQILRNRKELDHLLARIRKKDLQIGLIPTMGSIHEGHLSLVKKSTQNKLFSLSTIYINPTQFNDSEDYLKYPREEEKDIEKLSAVNCDALYFPTQEEMYPKGLESKKTVNKFRNILCDKFRLGHFDGVTTVVESLLRVTNPDHVFFGEKDFQQVVVIKRMIRDLNYRVTIVAGPLVREKSGLAVSSRNSRLKGKFRDQATVLWQAIQLARQSRGSRTVDVRRKLKRFIEKQPDVRVDYVEIVDTLTLQPVKVARKGCRLLLAAWVGSVRLIDNALL